MRYWKRKRWRNVAYIYVLENASNFTYTHLEYLRFWRVTPEESVISLAVIKDDPIFWQRWLCGDETYDRCMHRKSFISTLCCKGISDIGGSPDVGPEFFSPRLVRE